MTTPMRTPQNHTQRRAPSAALAVALALAGAHLGCSYDELKPGITVLIHNIPATADHLTAELSDSASGALKVAPPFGAGSRTDLEVVFPAIVNNGVVTVVVTALDLNQLALAAVTLTGNYQGPGLVLEGALVAK